MYFEDEANNITAYVQYKAYYTKKYDYFWGEIHKDGYKEVEITGNYMGFCDFDGVRYWDYREKHKIYHPVDYELPAEESLPSQASKRTDGIYKKTKTVEEAQEEKERLE